MVIYVPCEGDFMLTDGASGTFCAGSGVGGALDGTNTPGGTFMFVWGATSGTFVGFPWGTGTIVTGVVSGTNPCEAGVGGMKALEFVISLVGDVRGG